MNRTAGLAAGAPSIGDPYVPRSGNGGYASSHYDLELSYRPASNRLDGWARITATALAPLALFSLDLAGLRVSKVLIDGAPVSRFDVRGGKLTVRPAARLATGDDFQVDVRYSGNPRPIRSAWGGVGWDELADGVLVAGQPVGAPSWFPCNDHPSDKASYRIALTVDSPYTVVCNGALTSRRNHASMTTWVYEQPAPMATYLATVQVGRYDLVDLASGPVPQRAAFPARLRKRFDIDFARQPEMMQTFERCFGTYPFADYTVVVTDDVLEIPLEAQGLSVFGSNHVDGERGYERLIAHELAHQWFGNSLTVSRWQHIWLNEGFACYSEWLWSEVSGGPSASKLAERSRAELAGQPQDLVIADPGPKLMFDDRLYQRGALTLHALRHTIGEQEFFDLLRSWAGGNRHANVTTAEFIGHCERFGSATLDALFRSWLYEAKLPSLPSST